MFLLMIAIISGILAYAMSLYVLVTYTRLAGFSFIFAVPPTTTELIISYLLLWLIFFLIYGVARRVVSIVASPFQILTLGLIGILINIISIFVCQLVINTYLTGVTMQLGSLLHIVIGSFILSIMLSIVSYIVKKII